MRKIWFFSYSTSVFRLLKKTWGLGFVKEPSDRPYKHGPWEHDTADMAMNFDAEKMAHIRDTVRAAYKNPDGKGKGPAAPEVDNDEGTEEQDSDVLRRLEAQEAQDADRGIPVREPDDRDEEMDMDDDDEAPGLPMRQRVERSGQKLGIPASVRQRLWDECVAAGVAVDYTDEKTKETKPLKPKFYRRYQMMQLPEGFYFQHIILDECQTVRNAHTGWSRLVRLMIRAAYSVERDDIETNPSSLVLVSATPAINKQTDYRGIMSLF